MRRLPYLTISSEWGLLRALLATLFASLAVSSVTTAQPLPIKATMGASSVRGCEAASERATNGLPRPSPDALPLGDSALRSAIESAQDAAIQGDHTAARDGFALASLLAPSDPRIAYYLGREHEALREAGPAVREFCRYLALLPSAPDADEVRGRIARLTPVGVQERVDQGHATFRSGVLLLRRRQYDAAESEFSLAAQLLPRAPEPIYNRALARAARARRGPALQDFRQYLQLAPDTSSDRQLVAAAMTRLPPRIYSPPAAFATGLVLPGLGQFTTGRPLLGAAALGAVGGVLVWALQWGWGYEKFERVDANSNRIIDSTLVVVHPNAGAGYTYAAAIWLAAAYESMHYAQRSQARAASIIARVPVVGGPAHLVLTPLPHQRLGVGLAIRPGQRDDEREPALTRIAHPRSQTAR